MSLLLEIVLWDFFVLCTLMECISVFSKIIRKLNFSVRIFGNFGVKIAFGKKMISSLENDLDKPSVADIWVIG